MTEYKIPVKNASATAVEKFNHTYYQGLLIQLGRLEGHQTAIPAQDKNRLFLKEPLHQLATFTAPPAFTFDHLVNRAKMIDVGWYNERNFPCAFFEVEHSTDISNSLGKFVDFQDFRTKFFIVADEIRYKEWSNKMNQAQFVAIKGHVSFLSYKLLGQRYDNAVQKASLPSF